MSREYEIVSHAHLPYIHIFLVRLVSRTTHLHREMELGMVLEGKLSLHSGSRGCQLEKGDIYIINPLETHEFHSGGAGALVLSVQLTTRLMEGLLPGISNLRYGGNPRLGIHYAGRQNRYDLLCHYFVETAYAYFSKEPDYAYRCFASMAQVLSMLKHDLPELLSPPENGENISQRSERLLSVTDYIEENFTHKLLLEDIAKREGLSMTYLSHLFRDSMGVTFQDYLKEKRFEYACALLATTNRKILDISVSSGFSDVRYMTKLFQERFGCTPREYRKMAAAPEKAPALSLESAQYFFTRQDSYLLLAPVRQQLLDQIRHITVAEVMDAE